MTEMSVSETSTYVLTGLTCDHCVATVRAKLSGLDGVSDVTVDLVPNGESTVMVSSAAPLDRRVVRAAVVGAGYRLAR